jgi:hypothetical protein
MTSRIEKFNEFYAKELADEAAREAHMRELQEQKPHVGPGVELVEREPINEPLVHPLTGEAIDLAHAPDEEIARFLDGLKEHKAQIQEAQHIVTAEVLRRMDLDARYTRRAGPYVFNSSSPEPTVEYDALPLREDLLELVDQRQLTIDAVDRTVEPVVTYKVKKSGINALRKIPAVREIIDRHGHQVEKNRYVSVTRR